MLVSAVSGELLAESCSLNSRFAWRRARVTLPGSHLVRPTHQVVRGKRYATCGDEEPGCEASSSQSLVSRHLKLRSTDYATCVGQQQVRVPAGVLRSRLRPTRAAVVDEMLRSHFR